MTSFPTTIAGLTNGQQATYRRLLRRLLAKRSRNRTRTRYYEGKNELKDLGYALPPIAKDIEMVVGWPAKAVEALANRVVLDGVTTRDGSELSRTVSDLMDANDLAQTAENAHTDALVHSCSFVAAFRGDTAMGEPEAIIQEFPADCATGSWDPRMHALGEALLFDVSHDDGRNGKVRCGYLMSDGMIVTFAGDGTRFSKQTEAPYDGRIPCELLAYRPDSKRPFGRSRINRTVMSLTDSAVRTFLRSELQAELYSVPPRYFLGVTEDMFTDEDGESIPMWRIALDKVLAIPRDETTGSVPEVGQFQQYSFEPHVTQLRNTATMFAAATSLPPDAMGVLTSNPSSAAAIDKAVKELCLDAESCQRRFGPAWERIIDRAQKYAGSDGMATVRVSAQWRNPATPSRAAAADAAVKLVRAGILPVDSEVTWDMLDLSDRQRQTLRREAQKARAQARIDQLRIRTGQIEGAKDGTEQPEPFAGTTPTSGAAARPSV